VCSAQYACLLQFLNTMLSWYVDQYCLSDFEMVSFTPIITGITFAFTFHVRYYYYYYYYYYWAVVRLNVFLNFLFAVCC